MNRQPHFVHGRLAVNDRNLTQESTANQSLEIGSCGQCLPQRCRVAVQHRPAAAVHDGRIVNRRRIADDRLQKRVQPRIFLQNRGDSLVQLCRIGAIAPRTQIGFQRFARCVQHLVGDERSVRIGLGQTLIDQLRDIDARQRKHQGKHHPGDRQHQLRLQLKSRHTGQRLLGLQRCRGESLKVRWPHPPAVGECGVGRIARGPISAAVSRCGI